MKKPLKPLKTFKVDVDFYSMEFTIKARTAAEAKSKVREKIRKGVPSKNINGLYADEA